VLLGVGGGVWMGLGYDFVGNESPSRYNNSIAYDKVQL